MIISQSFEEHNKKYWEEQAKRKKKEVEVICARMDKNSTAEERAMAYALATEWTKKVINKKYAKKVK